MVEHNRRSDDTPMGKILKYWPIIVAAISLVGGFAVLAGTTNDNQTLLKEHALIINRHAEDIAVLKNAQAESSRNEKIMMQDIKEILRRSR